MAGNMPYWTEAVCEGHCCPKDCDSCSYADEAMELIQKEEEFPDVPWSWLESYVNTVEPVNKYMEIVWFLRDAKIAFYKEIEPDDDIEPDDSQLEMGFDPYLGCYTDDC